MIYFFCPHLKWRTVCAFAVSPTHLAVGILSFWCSILSDEELFTDYDFYTTYIKKQMCGSEVAKSWISVARSSKGDHFQRFAKMTQNTWGGGWICGALRVGCVEITDMQKFNRRQSYINLRKRLAQCSFRLKTIFTHIVSSLNTVLKCKTFSSYMNFFRNCNKMHQHVHMRTTWVSLMPRKMQCRDQSHFQCGHRRRKLIVDNFGAVKVT